MHGRALTHLLCWVFSMLVTLGHTTLHAQIQEKGEPEPGDTRWMKVIRGKYQKTGTQPSARPADKARAQQEPRREVNEKDLQTVKAEEATGTMLGITLWRMRPAREEDEVKLQSEEQLVTPVRVKSDTPLRAGDRIRITVESPRKGYLYVIDREQYTDGSTGRPQLIFPTQRLLDGENAVNQSVLLTVPGTDDNPSFFTLKRSGPEHKAEVITVLVSAEPLPGIGIGRNASPAPLQLSAKQVDEWITKWAGRTSRFDLESGDGLPMDTIQADVVMRKRALVYEDPLPQTLYWLPDAVPGAPLMISIPLVILD